MVSGIWVADEGGCTAFAILYNIVVLQFKVYIPAHE